MQGGVFGENGNVSEITYRVLKLHLGGIRCYRLECFWSKNGQEMDDTVVLDLEVMMNERFCTSIDLGRIEGVIMKIA